MITLSENDLEAIIRTVGTEVGNSARIASHPGIVGQMAEVVTDTIINRVVSPSYPNTVSDVVNQPSQFSAINGPRNPDYEVYGSWQAVPPGIINDFVREHVTQYVQGRVNGQPSQLQQLGIPGSTHFANPDPRWSGNNARPGGWVHEINPRYGGSGVIVGIPGTNFEHVHGTPSGSSPVDPFNIALEGYVGGEQFGPQNPLSDMVPVDYAGVPNPVPSPTAPTPAAPPSMVAGMPDVPVGSIPAAPGPEYTMGDFAWGDLPGMGIDGIGLPTTPVEIADLGPLNPTIPPGAPVSSFAPHPVVPVETASLDAIEDLIEPNATPHPVVPVEVQPMIDNPTIPPGAFVSPLTPSPVTPVDVQGLFDVIGRIDPHPVGPVTSQPIIDSPAVPPGASVPPLDPQPVTPVTSQPLGPLTPATGYGGRGELNLSDMLTYGPQNGRGGRTPPVTALDLTPPTELPQALDPEQPFGFNPDLDFTVEPVDQTQQVGTIGDPGALITLSPPAETTRNRPDFQVSRDTPDAYTPAGNAGGGGGGGGWGGSDSNYWAGESFPGVSYGPQNGRGGRSRVQEAEPASSPFQAFEEVQATRRSLNPEWTEWNTWRENATAQQRQRSNQQANYHQRLAEDAMGRISLDRTNPGMPPPVELPPEPQRWIEEIYTYQRPIDAPRNDPTAPNPVPSPVPQQPAAPKNKDNPSWQNNKPNFSGGTGAGATDVFIDTVYGNENSSSWSGPDNRAGHDPRTSWNATSQGYRDNYESSGGQSGMGGGTVICTYFWQQGDLNKREHLANLTFTRKHVSSEKYQGYMFWAVPYVRLMKRNKLARDIMRPLVKWRTDELAHQLGWRKKGSLKGKLVRLLFEPVSWTIGQFIGTTDYSHLWEESR